MSSVAKISENNEIYEAEHVHSVYDQIAPHFSSTRYKPWPIVEKFLTKLPAGSIGIDAGCGNGKYLSVNPDAFILGSDRSASLAAIAHENHAASQTSKSIKPSTPSPISKYRHTTSRAASQLINTLFSNQQTSHPSSSTVDVAIADALVLPHPSDHSDFALSIAVIHHLSSKPRRVAAIRELLRVIKPPAKRNDSGTDATPEDSIDDNFRIPIQPADQPSGPTPRPRRSPNPNATTGRALIFVWALEQQDSRRGWSTDSAQDVMVPWVFQHKPRRTQDSARRHGSPADDSPSHVSGPDRSTTCTDDRAARAPPPTTYQRYYHLYRQGELEEDVDAAGGRVVDGGYERDNWWAVVERGA